MSYMFIFSPHAEVYLQLKFSYFTPLKVSVSYFLYCFVN